MSASAYEVNGQVVPPAAFYDVACDPRRSVVVEACAGAGKTWMLVSRILRALLDGVPPQQILAITFTRKAAGEMRERLHTWLTEFAHASEARRAQELTLRGVAPDQVAALVPRLAQLHAEWLEGGRGVEIHTIHGWFSRLVKAAPLDLLAELQLPPELQLIEDIELIWPEVWGRFLRRVDAGAAQQEPTWQGFMQVVREAGRFNTEAWLKQSLHNRLEIVLADQAGVLDEAVPSPGVWDARWGDVTDPHEALARASVRETLLDLARQLGAAEGKTAQKTAAALVDALALTDLPQQARALSKALLTDEGEPRKRLGDVPDLAWAQAWLQDLQQALRQQEAHALHAQMAGLTRVLFAEYADHKRERGLADMSDLELAAARLLGDEALSGWVQQRLDAQVRQVLMDEFQDTSPLQWQALRAWLSAYAGAGGGVSGQQPVQVFLVGDPKQSIYRFRRADPRVFEAAKRFVVEGLGGSLLACDHTRRNAPGVIEALNRVMGQAHDEGVFPGFRAHTTASDESARLRVLPSVTRDAAGPVEVAAATDADDAGTTEGSAWRDSLTQPRDTVQRTVKEIEAEQVGDAVAELVSQGHRPDEVFVLSRTRGMLMLVAEALDAHGIAHVAPDDASLTDTPEVRDLLALVEVLVSPHHDLALAHALRSPAMGASNADLMTLAARSRVASCSWWQALSDEARNPACTPALSRAATLLARWQPLATILPPHDLLTRIVVEGEVRERTVAAVPASLRAQALFYIDALLAHSLDMGAGRDATPYKWVRTLRQVPVPLPARAQAGAVQLLTIHGAKGLEAKVVFLVDTDPAPPRRMSYGVLIDWPEGSGHPTRVAFVRSEGRPPPSLADALEAERQADQREELNALYVALTRARNELVVSRHVSRSKAQNSWWHRLVSSQAVSPEPAWVPVRVPTQHGDRDETQVSLPVLPVLAGTATGALPDGAAPAASAAASGSGLDADEATRLLGQTVHRALEWLTLCPLAERTEARLERAVATAAQALALPRGQWAAARAGVRRILDEPSLQAWLDPDRLAWSGNEVSILDEGQTLRLDRLVARQTPQGREWWVIDYKLSHRPDALPAYQRQLSRYVAAVARLQPGDVVRGAFISGDGGWWPLPE